MTRAWLVRCACVASFLPAAALLSQQPRTRDTIAVRDSARQRSNEGVAASNSGTPDGIERAASLFAEAGVQYEGIGDVALAAREFRDAGHAFVRVKLPDSARVYLARAMRLRRALLDDARRRRAPADESDALDEIGRIHAAAGRPDSARHYYDRARVVALAAGEHEQVAKSLDDVGYLHHDAGREDSALYYHGLSKPHHEKGEAQAVARRAERDRAHQRTLALIDSSARLNAAAYEANAKDTPADHRRAAGLWERTAALKRQLADSVDEAAALASAGDAWRGAADVQRARTSYQRALAIEALLLRAARARGDSTREAYRLENVADLHEKLEHADSAVAYYRSWADAARRIGRPGSVASAYRNLRRLYLTARHADSARAATDSLRKYEGLTRTSERTETTRESAATEMVASQADWLATGDSLRRAGRLDSARVLFARVRDATNVGDADLPDSTKLMRHREALLGLGLAALAAGEHDSAIAYLSVSDRWMGMAPKYQDSWARCRCAAARHVALAYASWLRRDAGDPETAARYLVDMQHALALSIDDRQRAVASIGGLIPAEFAEGLAGDAILATLALGPEVGSTDAAAMTLTYAERQRAPAAVRRLYELTDSAFIRERIAAIREFKLPGVERSDSALRATEAQPDMQKITGRAIAARLAKRHATGIALALARDTVVGWLILPSGEMQTWLAGLDAGGSPTRAARMIGDARATSDAARRIEHALFPDDVLARLPYSGDVVVSADEHLAALPLGALFARRAAEALSADPVGTQLTVRTARSLTEYALGDAGTIAGAVSLRPGGAGSGGSGRATALREKLARARVAGAPATAGVLRELAELFRARSGLFDPRTAYAYYDTASDVRGQIWKASPSRTERLRLAEEDDDLHAAWALVALTRTRELGPRRAALAALQALEYGRGREFLDAVGQLRSGARSAERAQSSPSDGWPRDTLGLEIEQSIFLMAGPLSRQCCGREPTILSYLVTSDTLVAWLAEPSGEVSVVRQPLAADSLQRLIVAARAAIGVDSASRLAGDENLELERGARVTSGVTSGENADSALARLAAAVLPSALVRRLSMKAEIIIVPHGVLGLVPFAALPVDGRGTPLGERHTLRYTPSLRVLEAVEHRARPEGFRQTFARWKRFRQTWADSSLVVGNPAMPRVHSFAGPARTLPPLPGADAEARWVADAVGARPLIGAAATETEVRRRLTTASMVHLATHGYAYAADSLAPLSFVALAPDARNDGVLTLGEIADSVTMRADLVVLSACQTGIGAVKRSEGLLGLQRTFLLKGARAVLVSLWSVSDVATRELMQRFYTHWLEDGDEPSTAEALARAQRDLRKDPRFAEPQYWAAFELVGANGVT